MISAHKQNLPPKMYPFVASQKGGDGNESDDMLDEAASSNASSNHSNPESEREHQKLNYQVKAFKMSKQFSEAFSKGISNIPRVNDQNMKPNLLHLTLHANDLSDEMLIGILEHVPGEILKELHISKNKRLTTKSYEILA